MMNDGKSITCTDCEVRGEGGRERERGGERKRMMAGASHVLTSKWV